MNEKDYADLELAKLLVKVGYIPKFDSTEHLLLSGLKESHLHVWDIKKWFFEKHSIFISTDIDYEYNKFFVLVSTKEGLIKSSGIDFGIKWYKTEQEAYLEAFKYLCKSII